MNEKQQTTLPNEAIAEIMQVVNGYQGTCVMMAAGELGLFAPLIRELEGLTAKQISEETHCDFRAVSVILDSLCAMGFLEKDAIVEGKYHIVEKYRDYLDETHPSTFIPMIRHLAKCMRQWGQLAWTAKAGFPAPQVVGINGARADEEAFILAMNTIARTTVEPLVQRMKEAGILTFRHFLDIGSGPGTYTMALLEAVPEAKATLFDLPIGLNIAKRRLTEHGYASRAEFVEGDFYRDPLPGGADFAWVSAIIHQHGNEESRTLYRKIYEALVPGGVIAVRDFVMNPNRTEPKAGTFFGVNMLSNTRTGKVYTYEEIREDLECAGFSEVQLAIPSEDMSSVVLARR